MSADESAATRATIQQFHAAFNEHDVEAIMELMTEDCLFENTYPPPDGQRYEGADAVRGFWVRLFAESPHAYFEVEDIGAGEDRGFLCWCYRWIDGDGKRGHVRGVDIFRVRDGKIAEKLSYVKG